jgi:hypothetical protein
MILVEVKPLLQESIMAELKTTIAARELGISYSRLMSLLRADKFRAPHKDSSGDYLWSQEDLEEAKQALSIDRRRKAISPGTDVEGTGVVAGKMQLEGDGAESVE